MWISLLITFLYYHYFVHMTEHVLPCKEVKKMVLVFTSIMESKIFHSLLLLWKLEKLSYLAKTVRIVQTNFIDNFQTQKCIWMLHLNVKQKGVLILKNNQSHCVLFHWHRQFAVNLWYPYWHIKIFLTLRPTLTFRTGKFFKCNRKKYRNIISVYPKIWVSRNIAFLMCHVNIEKKILKFLFLMNKSIFWLKNSQSYLQKKVLFKKNSLLFLHNLRI